MAITSAALKTELQTDPAALGYAALIAAGADQGCADALNLLRAGASFSVQLPTITSLDVQSCLDPTEFAALSATALSQLNVMLSGGTVNVAAANVRTILGAIFPGGGPTRTAIIAIVKRQGSRAEVLGGAGTIITHQDVAKALRG